MMVNEDLQKGKFCGKGFRYLFIYLTYSLLEVKFPNDPVYPSVGWSVRHNFLTGLKVSLP